MSPSVCNLRSVPLHRDIYVRRERGKLICEALIFIQQLVYFDVCLQIFFLCVPVCTCINIKIINDSIQNSERLLSITRTPGITLRVGQVGARLKKRLPTHV